MRRIVCVEDRRWQLITPDTYFLFVVLSLEMERGMRRVAGKRRNVR